MAELHPIHYIVGPVASGGAFLGREREVQDLSSIFTGVSSVHLVGPTRIGKSSLVNRVFERYADYPQRLRILINMSECENAFDFWQYLLNNLNEEIQDAGLWDPIFERRFPEKDIVPSDSPMWFTGIRTLLEFALKRIAKKGWRLVLAIDEFDAVRWIFNQNIHYYQTLRSMFSEPQYGTSGVLISRRRLVLLEAACPALSDFHNVFREMPLHAFSDSDMQEFYDSLSKCGCSVNEEGQQQMLFFTGRIPYLCSMFADRMTNGSQNLSEYGEKEVTSIFRQCLPQIDQFYTALIKRLDEDNLTEFIFYLSIGAKVPNITSRDIENMRTMGILLHDPDGVQEDYAYSQDFMTYFRLQPLRNIPAWDLMMNAEKKLKQVFVLEFPEFDSITYDDLKGPEARNITRQIDKLDSRLSLNWNTITSHCKSLSAHKENPTVLDVLTLTKVVSIILGAWVDRFCKYFKDPDWKEKLDQISTLRNPMAHAQIDCISSDELAVCLKYCEELIRLEV